MHALGLYHALMESLGDSRGTSRDEPESTEAVEPLDDATFDAWAAWARGERARWDDPAAPHAPAPAGSPAAPRLGLAPDRGVLGRL